MKSVTVRRELTDTEHKLVDESNYITAKLVEIAAMTEYSFAVFTRLSKCMPEIATQLQLEETVTG